MSAGGKTVSYMSKIFFSAGQWIQHMGKTRTMPCSQLNVILLTLRNTSHFIADAHSWTDPVVQLKHRYLHSNSVRRATDMLSVTVKALPGSSHVNRSFSWPVNSEDTLRSSPCYTGSPSYTLKYIAPRLCLLQSLLCCIFKIYLDGGF